MNIREQLHNGSLYLPGDEQLVQEQTICLNRQYDYNQTRPMDHEKDLHY